MLYRTGLAVPSAFQSVRGFWSPIPQWYLLQGAICADPAPQTIIKYLAFDRLSGDPSLVLIDSTLPYLSWTRPLDQAIQPLAQHNLTSLPPCELEHEYSEVLRASRLAARNPDKEPWVKVGQCDLVGPRSEANLALNWKLGTRF